ncbi:O-acetyl-ADP-ribose deacetylase [bacterium]|nr:O-acetyl-ADP-ribose deacetylase [bacterium]
MNSLSSRIEVIKADITSLEVDAIVNAANSSLLGGGGVDGAIHKIAGPDLLAECKTLNGCAIGQAKITKGYKLPAKFVIHTVGPIYQENNKNQEQELRNCYLNSLIIAKEKKLATIAFSAISTGVYGYPVKEAAVIAVREVIIFLSDHKFPAKVFFCSFSEDHYNIYQELLNKWKSSLTEYPTSFNLE